VNRIAFLVSKKIQPRQPGALWNNFNLTPPSTSVVVNPNTESSSAVHYDNPIRKNDFNDIFDEKRLLRLTPKKFRKNGEELLKQFVSRGSELNWDSSGTIYIDGTSIPESDIFILFPCLFRSKKPKKLEGFVEFFNKIIEMGLSDLLSQKVLKADKKPKEKKSD
jgi:hypothetical protein